MAEEIRLCRAAGYYDLADDARDWMRSRGFAVKYLRDGTVYISQH